MSTSIYDQQLDRNPANHCALTPLIYLQRAAEVYPDRLSIVHGQGASAQRWTWRQTYERSRRLASALQGLGIGKGDTVAVMLPNTPTMVEAHFGIPMSGAVLNALNTRLDASTIAFMLDHSESKVLIVDPEFTPVVAAALALCQSSHRLQLIQTTDALYGPAAMELGGMDYEALLASGDPDFAWQIPSDEWDAISLNYTSGTTGDPKGVVYHHRGAAINAVSNILEWDMPKHAVYLWTLPMFHANGWCFPWTLAARAAVNVCLRRVDPQTIFDLMREYQVSHYCGAPLVQSMLANAPAAMKVGLPSGIKSMVAGAPPPAAVIESMETIGFELTHVYGLTETYGPVTVCAKQSAWNTLGADARSRLNARQGVPNHMQWAVQVLDPDTLQPVPADGETMGEVMMRGNLAMKGYLKNPKANAVAFADGWFHSGDLAVQFPDGYIKIRDRSKDIIISGGENISSIEVEDVLYQHPAVLAVAVVAKPDPKWGESPCAFIELKHGAALNEAEVIAHCKQHLAGFKVPRSVVFGELPKTSTGKLQKFELRQRAASNTAIDV